MGQAISVLRKELEKADDADKAEKAERLRILENMVLGKLENEMNSILQGKRGNQEIHTGTIVQRHQQINIISSKKGDAGAGDIEDAISQFVQGSEGIVGGIGKILKLGARTVLGNCTMGEYEMNDMVIIWTSNALLRCDLYYYRWNFVSKGVIENTEGCLGVLLVKRVIDSHKVDPQVLTWAISNQVDENDDEEVLEQVDFAMKIFEKIVGFQRKLNSIEPIAPKSVSDQEADDD